MTLVRYPSALAVPLLIAGCSAATQDVATPPAPTSSTSTTATPTPATPAPGPVLPFRDYLASINVTGQPVPIAEAAGLEVTVPVPTGWTRAADPVFATGLEFIAPLGATGPHPSATLMAIRLEGDFDPKDAIRHANIDALPPRATGVTESFADYQGLPSALAMGVSDGSQHYSRFVIATLPAGQRYLVQLGATSPGTRPIARSPELTSIIDGFTVKTK